MKTDDEEVTIGVDKWPDRKHKCLYMMKGSVIEPLAYFKTDRKAEEFEKFFYALAQLAMNKGESK